MADEAAQLFEEGTAALRRLEYAEAREAFTKARPLYHQIGDVRGEANCILRLGDIGLKRSDHDTARRAFEKARPLFMPALCIRNLHQKSAIPSAAWF